MSSGLRVRARLKRNVHRCITQKRNFLTKTFNSIELLTESILVKVFNYLSVSRENRNFKVCSAPGTSNVNKSLESTTTTAAPPLCLVKDFIDVLGVISILGPLSVFYHPTQDKFIARGRQFRVYECKSAFRNPSKPFDHRVLVKSCPRDA